VKPEALAVLLASFLPRAHNNLGRADERSYLIYDRSIDFRGRHPTY
jgi:hypothetical protein